MSTVARQNPRPLLTALLCLAVWMPGRGAESPKPAAATVVCVQDPAAMESFHARAERVRAMVMRGITNLTGQPTPALAWRSLVSTQDVVGLKVFSTPGPNSGTRVCLAAAVIEGLLEAGVPPRQIVVWDRNAKDLRMAGFYDLADHYHIRVESSTQAGWDPAVAYDTARIGSLVWGDVQFGQTGPGVGRKSFVSKLLTSDITKIVNLSPLLNHNTAGVTGNLYSLALGSVDNIIRFENAPGALASAVPEIYALPALGDRVVLNITDALICQYEGEDRGLLHYSTMLGQLRLSKDPVALDALSVQELELQRQLAKASPVHPDPELLNNAALLELGVADLRKIEVRLLRMPP